MRRRLLCLECRLHDDDGAASKRESWDTVVMTEHEGSELGTPLPFVSGIVYADLRAGRVRIVR